MSYLIPISIEILLNVSVITIGFNMVTNGITISTKGMESLASITDISDEDTKLLIKQPPELEKARSFKFRKRTQYSLDAFRVVICFFFILLMLVSFYPEIAKPYNILINLTSFHIDVFETSGNIVINHTKAFIMVIALFLSWMEMGALIYSFYLNYTITQAYVSLEKECSRFKGKLGKIR